MILGIDEVGRGPWAGPLVVGAVVLGGAEITGLTDSKKLTKARREALNEEIIAKASGVGLGWVMAEELDEIGLSKALKLATIRAVEQIKTPYHEIVIDGTINFLADTAKGQYVSTMKKADLLVPSVSAASIVAKVARDRHMEQQHELYPGYGFASHVGYGTAKHRKALQELGVTPLHRLSFAPLAQYRAVARRSINTVPKPTLTPVTSRSIGDKSEEMAANELVKQGHVILERNWKTKFCEIDIISKRDETLYFTEVKHRKNADSGDGLAAITAKKVQQMRFAAEAYAHMERVKNVDMQLLAIATHGEAYEVGDVVIVDEPL